MIKVQDLGIILSKTELEFESQAVLNPACIKIGKFVHMFYRAVAQKNHSTIGYCKLLNNKIVERSKKPILVPEFAYEKQGVEDPRIIYFENKYFLFYTAYDGQNALAAYATSNDCKKFTKHGLISPQITYDEAKDMFTKHCTLHYRYRWYEQHYKKTINPSLLLWEKDVMIFPKRINNKIFLLHRVIPGIQLIKIISFKELTLNFWHKHLENLCEHILLDPVFWFETRKIGGGCPPIRTPEGWLLIYHSVEDSAKGNIYRAAAALLDLKNPQKVIGRLPYPLFEPNSSWEKKGNVTNVVFPTGAIVEGPNLIIYYGASDTCIAAKKINLKTLIKELLKNPLANQTCPINPST